MTTKVCTGCKLPKDRETDFHKHPPSGDGRHPRCKVCRREYEASRYKGMSSEQRRRRNKKSQPRTRFQIRKMSEEEYQRRMEEQAGVCAICFQQFDKLCIDHDHVTGENRGLLCGKCNAGIGFLQESETILAAAIKYLRRHGRVA